LPQKSDGGSEQDFSFVSEFIIAAFYKKANSITTMPHNETMDKKQEFKYNQPTPPQSGRGMVVLVRYLSQGSYPFTPQSGGV
jgi:hypothetical protein